MTRRLATIILMVALAIQARAQAVPFVTIPTSAGNLALGGAHVATPDTRPITEGVFEAGVDKLLWQTSAINYNITNVNARIKVFNPVTLGLDYTHNGMEEMTLYDENGQGQGTTQPNEMCIALSLTYTPVKQAVLTARGKFIRSSLTDNNSASAVAADIGATWQFNRSVTAGLRVENFGSGIDYGYGPYPLPTSVKAGYFGIFPVASKHSIETAADAGAMPAYSAYVASLGAGYVYNKMLSLRLGAHICSRRDILPTYASAGIFFTSNIFDIGAAYISASNTYSISARLKL